MTSKEHTIFKCTKIRMMQYLRECGWVPYKVIVEPSNGKYFNWLYITENNPELQADIDAWFSQQKARKE